MRLVLLLTSLLISSASFAQYSNESELSMVITNGNSELKTINAKTTNKYKMDMNVFTFGGHYTYGEASDVESARNWDLNLRYDRELSKKLSAFLGEAVEGDKFSGYDQRYNTDLGGRYIFCKSDKGHFLTELGARYTVEKSTASTIEDKKDTKARLYAEGTRVFSESVNGKLWSEYIPNFSESTDWLWTSEVSLNVTLSSMFSFKTAFKGAYDNLPATGKKFDSTYTNSLIAKF